MRRMRSGAALAVAIAAVTVVVPPASPRVAAERPITVTFGVSAHDSGVGSAELRGRGVLTGLSDLLGTDRLNPVADAEGRPPTLTFSESRLGRERTYRLFVHAAQYNKTPRSEAVVLSVEVFDTNDPDCRERTPARPGARGRVILAQREEGRAVTIELACGIDVTWNDDPNVGIDVRLGKPKPKPATTTTAGAVTFTLVQPPKVTNLNAKELTIQAAAGTATLNHCCDGGKWKSEYAWRVPKTLTAGKAASITLSVTLSDVDPQQPINEQISALAPDFRQDLAIHYPDRPSATKTYPVPISASQAAAKEILVYVAFVNAEIRYTYRRSAS
jgi:hypothetical protein